MRIVPAVTVQTEQAQRAAITDACLRGLPLQTHFYILNYARAENAAPVISKMLSSRGSAVAYAPRNALIVTDVEHPEECSH